MEPPIFVKSDLYRKETDSYFKVFILKEKRVFYQTCVSFEVLISEGLHWIWVKK